jgi:hypothetical protein
VSATRFVILVTFPFLLIGAAFFGARAIDFEELVFTPNELKLLYFTPDTVEVRLRRDDGALKARVLSKRRSMGDFFYFTGVDGAAVAGKTPVGRQRAQQAADPLALNVSLIMLDKKGALAIVNNRLVMEGDTFDGVLVKRIEADRVLLKGKESRWVYMEGKR